MVKGKGARIKGHSWERKVVNDLKDIDDSVKRLLEYQEGKGYDIDTSLPYLIQCKSKKQINWISALNEVPEVDKKIPIVIGKVTNKGEYAFLRWSDLLKLFKRIHIAV